MREPAKCYDCKLEITDLIVWLGEKDQAGVSFELPFHERCADQPWPLYEIRREPADPPKGEA